MKSRASKNARMVRLRMERSRSFLFARRSRSVMARGSALDALAVLAGARVDAEEILLVDEERHVDGGAGLERGRLLRAARGVALDARLRRGDAELDEVRQGHADGAPVPEQHEDHHVVLEPLPVVADEIL